MAIAAALAGVSDLYAVLRDLGARLPDLTLSEVLEAAPHDEARRLARAAPAGSKAGLTSRLYLAMQPIRHFN